MKTKVLPKTVRRSVALSRQLVEQVSALAPPELRQNLNRLVTVALQEFAAHQKARAFEDAIGEAQVLGYQAVIVELERLSGAGQVVELAARDSFFDSPFGQEKHQ